MAMANAGIRDCAARIRSRRVVSCSPLLNFHKQSRSTLNTALSLSASFTVVTTSLLPPLSSNVGKMKTVNEKMTQELSTAFKSLRVVEE